MNREERTLSRVLVALADGSEGQALRSLLLEEGDEVRPARSFEDTLRVLEETSVDQVLFDLRLAPPAAGLRQSLTALREAGAAVLVLAAPPAYLERLDPGLPFDDFLLTPLHAREAQLRLQHALWRHSNIQDGNLIKSGDLVIDLVGYQVRVAGAPVPLTFKEYELLRLLASNPGRVFKRDTLLNRVWGYDYYGGGRTVDVHIRRLRSKIETGGRSFIETVRNVGYRFAGPEQRR